MTPAITLFFGLTFTLAAIVVLYIANLRFVLARPGASALSALPVVTPVHAWRLGARALPVSFAVCIALYVVFRVSARAGGLS